MGMGPTSAPPPGAAAGFGARSGAFTWIRPGTLAEDLLMDAQSAAPVRLSGSANRDLANGDGLSCMELCTQTMNQMGDAPEDQPITPHAGPIRDPSGLLSYIGDDGRRYVVGSQAEAQAFPGRGLESQLPDAVSAERVMRDLRRANSLYRRIESLCRDWIAAVQSRDLERGSALELLLATLETTLEEPDSEAEDGDPEA